MSGARQGGFVLLTGLVFLAVTTLLTLSTLAATNLHQRMATNQREKARAQEAADAALRAGESRLAQLRAYPVPGRSYRYDPTPRVADSEHDVIWRLWSAGEPLAALQPGDDPFLAPAAWRDDPERNDPTPSPYSGPGFDPGLAATAQIYIEQTAAFAPADLNPDTRARARGAVLYRITARASGGNPATTAIIQCLYQKRY